MKIVEKDLTGEFRLYIQAIEIDILHAIIRTQSNHITFVSNNVSHLVLAEKTFEWGVPFPDFFSGFDGETDMHSPAKSEAEHGVGNVGRAPIDKEKVDRLKI